MKLLGKWRGDGLGARMRRSTIFSVLDFGGSQALRLISNLILTRLLFPEAFGLMALVTVILAGLKLLSDTGVRNSIIQNVRGEDPAFLDTAWTVQVIRGGLLWVIVLLITGPFARLYGLPELTQILPVAGVVLLIDGLTPTAAHTANKQLILGRFTMIHLGAQLLTLIVTVVLTWQMQSVWALVVGSVFGQIAKVTALWLFLPNAQNRLWFEWEAFWEIFHFGKWIFVAALATFSIAQADRALLGLYISLADLGIYNIGALFAGIPIALWKAINTKVLFPLYCLKPPKDGRANQTTIFRVRRTLVTCLIIFLIGLAFWGPSLISLLYDSRYAASGPILSLFCLPLVLQVSLNYVGAGLLADGNARAHFLVTWVTALCHLVFLTIGLAFGGIGGAVLALGFAVLARYPLCLKYARSLKIWDPVQDIWITLIGLGLCAMACFVHLEAILPLFQPL